MRKSIYQTAASTPLRRFSRVEFQGLQQMPELAALASRPPADHEIANWLQDFLSIANTILQSTQIIFGPLRKTSQWPVRAVGVEVLPPALVHEIISTSHLTLNNPLKPHPLSEFCSKTLPASFPSYGSGLRPASRIRQGDGLRPASKGKQGGRAGTGRAIEETSFYTLQCGAFLAVNIAPACECEDRLFAAVATLLDGALLQSLEAARKSDGADEVPRECSKEKREHEPDAGILICNDKLQPVFANDTLLRLIAAPVASFEQAPLSRIYPAVRNVWEQRQPSQMAFDLQTQIAFGSAGYADLVPMRLGETDFVMLILHRGAPAAILQRHLVHSTMLAALGEVAGGMVHEINNPVTSIINYARLLQLKKFSTEELQEFTQAMISEGERIAAIVRSLHLFGRQEPDELQPVAVNQLVAAILALHRSRFNRDGITLECTYDNALPEIMGRSDHIAMALMHLMQNARLALKARFTDYDENKLLRVRTRRVQRGEQIAVQITVADNGIGIANEISPLIFTPLFSAWPHAQRSGMGLFMAKAVAKNHHGTLDVVKNPELRTAFALQLPTAR